VTKGELPELDELIRRALAEDLGLAGDITSDAIFPADHHSTARIVVRRPGTLAGVDVACRAFTLLDPSVEAEVCTPDGSRVGAMTDVVRLAGPTRALLAAERTALNLLGRLSGIATATAELVALVEGTGASITDTRKTTPTLRALEKYAVRMGGGSNHRFGLHDAVLIKDNHVAAAGSVTAAVERVRRHVGHTVKIEVEVETLAQVEELLAVGADIVLFDNMALPELAEAVRMVGERMITEASGGIDRSTVRAVAETGVQFISVGSITHSAPALDVALDVP
jgi:nicotinate-nucleotide pyrophosphorylase (carboxylating)